MPFFSNGETQVAASLVSHIHIFSPLFCHQSPASFPSCGAFLHSLLHPHAHTALNNISALHTALHTAHCTLNTAYCTLYAHCTALAGGQLLHRAVPPPSPSTLRTGPNSCHQEVQSSSVKSWAAECSERRHVEGEAQVWGRLQRWAMHQLFTPSPPPPYLHLTYTLPPPYLHLTSNLPPPYLQLTSTLPPPYLLPSLPLHLIFLMPSSIRRFLLNFFLTFLLLSHSVFNKIAEKTVVFKFYFCLETN